ncbi:MAG: HAMP domain-containing protein [Chitinophagaceae bacterium]|nr:HAMP domain-containing protein [Chitinophagaceae bacterium]
MKARYKITTAFMLLTVIVLAALCAFVYYHTAAQKEKISQTRLRNRAATVASFLFKLPEKDFTLLSKLDSSTSSLLAFENISIYNNRNQRIYRYAKNVTDTAAIDAEMLNKARLDGQVNTNIGQRQSVALYYQQSESPVVILVSAVDENGILNLYDLRKSLLFALVAGIFLAFISGWFFSRQLLNPISKISTTVTSISATNIEARLPTSTVEDEWNQLAVTFNNLLSRLQESFEIQGRFISNAAHELSTPLTSMSNQIDVVLHKSRTNEEYLAVLQSVKADVHHMTSLTQQLLKLAQTARGGAIQTEPVRIDEVLMELPLVLKKISPLYQVKIFLMSCQIMKSSAP